MHQKEEIRKLLIWKLISCILDEKSFKMVFFPLGDNPFHSLTSLVMSYSMHKIMSNIWIIGLVGLMLANKSNGWIFTYFNHILVMYLQCLLVVNSFKSLYTLWQLFYIVYLYYLVTQTLCCEITMVPRCCKTIMSCDPMFTMALLFRLGQLRGSLASQRLLIWSQSCGSMIEWKLLPRFRSWI